MAEFSFEPSSIPSEVASVASSIVEGQPQVSEHAVSAHEEAMREAAASVETDKAGTPFDPEKHTGTKLKDGTWRLRKSARAGGSSVASPRGKKTSEAAPQDATAEQAKANAYAAGAVAASSVFMLGRAFGGEEWEPTADEVKMQAEAWGAYFHAKGVNDFPPGVTLLIAVGSYAGPRFTKPKTKQRLKSFKQWLMLKIARRKIISELKKRGVKAEVVINDGAIYINGTRSDLWNNGKREDASREKP